jgi:hypothetical protein
MMMSWISKLFTYIYTHTRFITLMCVLAGLVYTCAGLQPFAKRSLSQKEGYEKDLYRISELQKHHEELIYALLSFLPSCQAL